MADYFHYTLRKHVPSIRTGGMAPNIDYFTLDVFYDANQAGQAVGVMAHYIDVVLKFADDGKFKKCPNVPSTERFMGGATAFRHLGRPKPVAMRGIMEKDWTPL